MRIMKMSNSAEGNVPAHKEYLPLGIQDLLIIAIVLILKYRIAPCNVSNSEYRNQER